MQSPLLPPRSAFRASRAPPLWSALEGKRRTPGLGGFPAAVPSLLHPTPQGFAASHPASRQ